jgi:AP2-associated kinase
MPSKSVEAAKVEDGFGDSFGAPQQGVKATAAKFGGTAAARSSSGFDDSFGAQRKSLSPKKSVPAVSGGLQTSPSRRRDPSSSIPDGGLSFEARFPSIETLSSGGTFSPSLPQPSSAPSEHLVSPVTSPPVSRPGLHPKASVMSHLTGETAPPHISIGSGIPQPRSTQVTGTAFKGIQGGMLSPSPLQPRTDYFESANLHPAERKTSPVQTGSSAKSPLPQDLMTGEEFNELSVPLMRPGRTPSPTVSASVASVPSPGFAAKSPPTSGHSRPLLPHISSIKPSSNINSEQWSPLERMRNQDEGDPRRGPSPAELAAALEPDSSDEEVEQPEEASGTSRRPASPVRRGSGNKLPPSPKIAQRMSMFENDFGATASLSQRQASPTKSATAQKFPIKSATLQIPADVRPEPRRGSASSSEGRSRPQSMFISSTSPMLSPNDPGTAPLEQGSRPAHSRQGSLGDMVSRYENLESPSAGVSAPSGEPPAPAPKVGSGSEAPVNGAGGLGRKPSVAAKPAALRRGTITNDKPAPPELEAPSKAPTAVSSPTKSSSKSESKPVVAAKPAIQPKPVRYGDMPAVAGYSRSSSGRSFPITKPGSDVSKPSIDTSVVDADVGRNARPNSSDKEKGAGGPRSGSGSPEKQQPVSSLIARWNKGEVGGKPPPVKRGGYI